MLRSGLRDADRSGCLSPPPPTWLRVGQRWPKQESTRRGGHKRKAEVLAARRPSPDTMTESCSWLARHPRDFACSLLQLAASTTRGRAPPRKPPCMRVRSSRHAMSRAPIRRRNSTAGLVDDGPHSRLLALQKTIGNQAVSRLIARSRVQRCPGGCPASGCGHDDEVQRQPFELGDFAGDLRIGRPLSSVRIWMKAFIPGQIPELTETVPDGPHAGKTMIPGPTFLNDCFLTDNRSFDSDESAKARLTSFVELDLSGSRPVLKSQRHYCDPTMEVDCEDGDVECSQAGSNEGSFTNLRIDRDGTVLLDLEAFGNNPCFTGSPSIDMWGTISIRKGPIGATVSFDGAIDAFPDFELYANGMPLLRRPHPPGNSPGDLFGGAVREAKGSALVF